MGVAPVANARRLGHHPRMPDDERRLVTLEFAPDADPIEGRIEDAGGKGHEFVGWLGLAAALQSAMRGPDVTEPADARGGSGR